MATMVPPTIRPRTPPGEVKVFEALRDHPGTAGWLVWHGLPVRHHETQVEGEADFVVMVPGEGMLVVEVKSHDRLEVDDRGWSLGGGEPTARSPYDQVWDNSRSIRTWIERRAYVPGYPIWQAAWFPNMGGELTKRLEQRIDVPADATLTRADLDPSRLVTSIVRILRHGARELERRVPPFDTGRPDEQDIADARAALVPAVRWDLELADRREARRRNLQEATERQEEALRYFASNERLIVTGPAGTGKTNIAVRAAQLQGNRDERVLLTCFNKLLEADLHHRLRNRGDITVARVHQLMLAYSGLTPPPHADDAWWNGALPAATLAVTRAPDFEPPFTCLVADEAQDLARDSTLDVLDSLLVGGLAGSRVVLAGDYTRQDIYRPRSRPLLQQARDADRLETITRRLPGVATMTLTNNVRQPPELAAFIEAILGRDVYTGFDREGDDDEPSAELHLYRSPDQQGEQLQSVLASLWDDGWEPEEIVILSPKRDSAAAHARGLVVDALATGGMTGSGVRWGTIHAFKGLESPVVIVTDVDETGQHWEDLLYVGMTRATDRLVVLTCVEELAARVLPAHLDL
ncbi:NERD domain-containing protein [Agrococcus sp. DT81.2]|uniref:nuclease-related domain-containing DEAD/DEAH box helicase n=1 Tax=Agrococcus sp. DT81.2 TaxID=3393414 RepID=UPI003CE52088